MDPSLVSFAIKGAFRLGKAGKVAYEQNARNKEILLPHTNVVQQSSEDELISLVRRNREKLLKPGSKYLQYWNESVPMGPKEINGSKETSITQLKLGLIEIRAVDIAKAEDFPPDEARTLVGADMIEQWGDDKGPPHPWVHIALTIVDVGLEFVAAKPELLGIDGNGAKVVGAIADSLGDVIPEDTTEFDLKSIYGERLIAAFLKGALQGVSENSTTIFREKHLQELATKTLAPVIAEIDNIKDSSNAEKNDWMRVVEAMTGPAAQAAVGVLAEHPEAFLGKDFTAEKAGGALAQAILKEAAKRPLGENFSEDGLLAMFKAALGVAAKRPELFLGKADGATDEFRQDAFVKVMTILEGSDAPFSKETGLNIATSVLDVLGEHAVELLDVHDDWDEVVDATVGHVLSGLKSGVRGDGKGLDELYSTENFRELARVLVTQVAENPSMIVGTTRDASNKEVRTWRKELKTVTAAVAGAMAADEKLLLSGRDWVQIAEVAARTAAANPGPLFGLDESDIGSAAASGALTTILTVAAESFSGTRAHGDVMFGEALREAMIETVKRLPRNVKLMATGDGKQQLKELLVWAKDHVSANKDKIGSEDWLRLYNSQLPKLLSTGKFTPPTPEQISEILGIEYEENPETGETN